MNPDTSERFVDADAAATFLSLTRRRVLDLARAGHLRGYPLGDGARCVWRFRLSEIAAAITERKLDELGHWQKPRPARPEAIHSQVDKYKRRT